jgi:predicted alpha/beta-fold hydrolase
VRRHMHQVSLNARVQLSALDAAVTLHQFDSHMTCKALGFADAKSYYAAGASANFIPRVRTPMLFVAAEDDPFLGALPLRECLSNPHTALALTSAGGHCAHLQVPLSPVSSPSSTARLPAHTCLCCPQEKQIRCP